MIRDTEQGSSLYDLTRCTQEEQQIPIIVIIDEEHMFAGKLANKSEKVLCISLFLSSTTSMSSCLSRR